MPELFLTIFFISILLFFLGTGIWVALSMVGVSTIGMLLFTSRPVGDAMATTIWGHDFGLTGYFVSVLAFYFSGIRR